MPKKFAPQTLRTARIGRKISLRQMAKKLGFSATYLGHIETGKCPIPTVGRPQIRALYGAWVPRTTAEERDLLLACAAAVVREAQPQIKRNRTKLDLYLGDLEKAIKEVAQDA